MGARLVAIETTTRVTSVALFDGARLVRAIEREAKGDVVVVMIDELLKGEGIEPKDVARWAVDVGPGSFTGVRVGVATVKGLAFATGAEVVGVTAFDAVARGADAVVILEAGKGEVYFRIGSAAPSHAPLDVVKKLIEGHFGPVLGPNVLPTAEGVGLVALGRAPDDIDQLSPLYVRAPDLTKPK